MARKKNVAPNKYAGSRKVVPNERQREAHTGRKQNVTHKETFKAGAFARTDPNAGSTRAQQMAPPTTDDLKPGS